MLGPEHVRAMENAKMHSKRAIETPNSITVPFDGQISNSAAITNNVLEAMRFFRTARESEYAQKNQIFKSDSFFGEALTLYYTASSLCENPELIRGKDIVKTEDRFITSEDILSAACSAACSAEKLDAKSADKAWFHGFLRAKLGVGNRGIEEFARAERLSVGDEYSLILNMLNRASSISHLAGTQPALLQEGITLAEKVLTKTQEAFESARKGHSAEYADEWCIGEKYNLVAAFGITLNLYESALLAASPELKAFYEGKIRRTTDAWVGLNTPFPNASTDFVNGFMGGHVRTKFFTKKH